MDYKDEIYKAKKCGHAHNKGCTKSWKQWNDIYMIDVRERGNDFHKLTIFYKELSE